MATGWHLERALQSRVARRVAGLFIVCALLPLASLALVTTWRTSGHLEREADARLRYDAKTVMMEALARLELLSHTLRVLGSTLASREVDPAAILAEVHNLFPTAPVVLTYVPDGAAPRSFGAAVTLPLLDDTQRGHLGHGRPLIVPHDELNGLPLDLLYVPGEASGGSGVMVASVDYQAIFGLDDLDPLPPDTEICVFDRGRTLVCSAGVAPAVATAAAGVTLDPAAPGRRSIGDLSVHARTIPLQAGYASRPWTIVMMKPQSLVGVVRNAFLRDFWMVLALSLLITTLVTISRVRRQLRPLLALIDGTRRLARRDFTTPVQISSHDEFEELGQAINRLSSELQEQFGELEAFSIGTLETLARAIDAKSSWTTGHSQRVTELAVAIGLQMALPSEEIGQLRRGGLVHDIGKLATPPEILDKPTLLTDEEMRIMRNHAQQGVHILEPIPAFGALLPIVGQHHERWDGGGYPNGLAGTAIARTARVLAVADVFDAMRSSRPYRAGLPMDDVVRQIRAGAGSRFDPDAVAAFSSLIARTADQWTPRVAPDLAKNKRRVQPKLNAPTNTDDPMTTAVFTSVSRRENG